MNPPSILINIIGDYSGRDIEGLRKALLDVLDAANEVQGWVLVSGPKTIELIGEILSHEGSFVVDDEHDGLVCISLAPFGVIHPEDQKRLLDV